MYIIYKYTFFTYIIHTCTIYVHVIIENTVYTEQVGKNMYIFVDLILQCTYECVLYFMCPYIEKRHGREE